MPKRKKQPPKKSTGRTTVLTFPEGMTPGGYTEIEVFKPDMRLFTTIRKSLPAIALGPDSEDTRTPQEKEEEYYEQAIHMILLCAKVPRVVEEDDVPDGAIHLADLGIGPAMWLAAQLQELGGMSQAVLKIHPLSGSRTAS